MDTTVQIVLIVAAAILIILIIFRRQISEFRFKGGKEGVDMTLKTKKDAIPPASAEGHPEHSSVRVSGNRLWGRRNKVDVQRGSTAVEDNEIVGEDQEIRV